MTDPLAPQVRQLFQALLHAGEPTAAAVGGAASDALESAAGSPRRVRLVAGEAGRERRGTRVRFTLRLAGERLLEVRYRAYGCPYTLATCEWLAQRLERDGRHGIGGAADWAAQLQIPPGRIGRLLVVEDALRAAWAASERSDTPELSGTDS